MPRIPRPAPATTPCLALLIGLTAVRVSAQPVDFSVSLLLNTDTIVNMDPDPPTPFDEDNDPVGNVATNFALLTQSAAVAAGCPSPVGLPDNGFFPANADHPDVHLSYENQSSGLNTRRSSGAETYSIITPANNYSDVHFFFTSGSGNTNATVTLRYLSGPPAPTSFTVPSWVGPAIPPAYHLFDGGDRLPPDEPFVCDDANTTAIYGYDVPADPTRLLASID